MIMDEEAPAAFEYYTIQNQDCFVGITDLLGNVSALRTRSEDGTEEASGGDKSVFYFTFNNEDSPAEDSRDEVIVGGSAEESWSSLGDPLLHAETSEDAASEQEQLLESTDDNIRLIPLEDGLMLMTSGLGFDSVIKTDGDVQEEALEVSSQTVINEEEEEEEESNDAETSYQVVELMDGSQAIIKIIKINKPELPEAEKEEEESPKKLKRFHCFYEGCDKIYATSYHLTVHMRTHTDSKPYECYVDGCAKKFSTNYSLKAHIRTHTGEKPYGCSMCSKQFKTSGDLQKHIRIHTGEKPFMCPIEGCGKSFTTSNIRKVHVRSHTGERPYNCTVPNCGKAFTSSTNYKNHLRIHSGEKPYVCAVAGCGKRFTEYSSLYKHNSVHQLARPHGCIFCGQRFKQESALNFHKRLKHNVVVTKDGTEIMVKID